MRSLDGARNALVLGSPTDPTSAEACMDLLAREESDRLNVLTVLLTNRPDRRVEEWKHHVGALPARFEILSSQQPSSRLEGVEGVDVEVLGGPGNLTAIGVAITDRLAAWPPDEPGAVCVHSATALLQHATSDQVYQFLYTLRDHLAEEGVHGHVHLNPGAHDEQTVETLKTLFDAVVEVGEGETTVRTR